MRGLALPFLVFSQISLAVPNAVPNIEISELDINGAARVFVLTPPTCNTVLRGDPEMGIHLTTALLVVSKALGRNFEDPGDLATTYNLYERIVLSYLLSQPAGNRFFPKGFELRAGSFGTARIGTTGPLETLVQVLNDNALLSSVELRVRRRVSELQETNP